MAKKIKEPKTLEELEALIGQDIEEAMKELNKGLQDPPFELSPESEELLKKELEKNKEDEE